MSTKRNVPTPVGATLPEPKPSAEDPEADPDLERWQHDRWAPHPLEDETGKTREFVRDGSYHDLTLAKAEAEAQREHVARMHAEAEAEEAERSQAEAEEKPKPKPKRRTRKAAK